MNAVISRTARHGPTVLRIAPMRWLVAELIPFACLSLGLTIAREWRPVMAIGYLVALFGTYTLSLIYLYKVIGTAVGWCLSLLPFIAALMWVGGVTVVGSATTQSSQNSTEVKIVATSSWWIAGICLAVVLALIVMAAIVNGEHWMRRNWRNLPRNKYEAYVRSRGTLARIWLPR
jgi:hypothetical protein